MCLPGSAHDELKGKTSITVAGALDQMDVPFVVGWTWTYAPSSIGAGDLEGTSVPTTRSRRPYSTRETRVNKRACSSPPETLCTRLFSPIVRFSCIFRHC